MSPRRSPVPDVPAFDPDEVVDGEFEESPPIPTSPEKEAATVSEPAPIRSLVASASDQHVVVGMASLANMTDEEFARNLAIMEKGQARLRTIQDKLLVAGEDYGRVKGIEKPFLHQPGAEKLANFYGFAVRQEVERITRQQGDSPDVPPYEFIVKSFVHLGSFDGPIIAQGFGEASPFEEKHRYLFTKPACPVCGKTGNMLTRKTPPQLAGKVQCANFGDKQGCGTVFEPNDPRLGPSGKEENPDLWSLAETILLMASKRSHVSAVRRATGTSGLFTQDPDSPSVQAQSNDSGPGDDAPPSVIEAAKPTEAIGVGGRGNNVTAIQLSRLTEVAKEKGLKGSQIAELLERLFDLQGVEHTGAGAMAAVRKLTADQVGQLLHTMETGELPQMGDDPVHDPVPSDPGSPPQQADEM